MPDAVRPERSRRGASPLRDPLIVFVTMLLLTLAIAFVVRLPIIFAWEILRPETFHERTFEGTRWRSFEGIEVGNDRGQMYDDLVGRDLLTLGAPENRAPALLGPPDEREAGRQYWLTGRWHSASDTCLVVVFGSDGRLRRFALVKLAGRASLTFHCAAGTLLPQSLPAASKR